MNINHQVITIMRTRITPIILAAALFASISLDAEAQDKAVQRYNAAAMEAATARWSGKDLNVSTIRLSPGVQFGGHWILFMPLDVNIDMYNTQTTRNFQVQTLLGAGAGYGQECKNGCFWDASYSWSTTLQKMDMNYHQHHINFRLGFHTTKGDLFCQAGAVLRRDWQTGGNLWMPTVGMGIRL